jgi:hypothetical protein
MTTSRGELCHRVVLNACSSDHINRRRASCLVLFERSPRDLQSNRILPAPDFGFLNRYLEVIR